VRVRTEYTRERLQVRSRSLSQNYRVGLKWGGCACTNGKTIFLPMRGASPHIDEMGSVEKLVSLHALAIHEAAHLRYSSFEVLEEVKRWPAGEAELGMHILNILEDSRVELLVSNSHPGTADYLRFFNELAFETWLPELSSVPGGAEQFLQALAQLAICGRMKGTPGEDVLEVLEDVRPLVDGARRSTDPRVPLAATKEIVQKIKERWGLPSPPKPPVPFRLDGFDEGGNSVGMARMNAESDTAGRELVELHVPGGPGGEDDGPESGDSDEGKDGGRPGGSRLGGLMSPDLVRRVESELKRAEKEVKEREMETAIDEATEEKFRGEGIRVSSEFVDTGNRDVYLRICSEIAPVKKQLVRKLKDLLTVRSRTRRGLDKGRLDPTRVHRVALGRMDVFYRRSSRSSERVGFLLLVDESGSMRVDDRYVHARKAAVLFSEVLRELKIAHMVMGFTADSESVCSAEHRVYRTFSERHARASPGIASITARVNNRDHVSIRVAVDYLARQPFQKRVLLVISDGEPAASDYTAPESVRETARAVRDARKRGIRVIGISIDPGAGNYLHEIYPSRVVVKRLEELPAKLLKVARRELA